MAKLTLTLPQAFERAVTAYTAGKFAEAEQLCKQIIAVKRDDFEALHLLAIVQSGQGKRDAALASYERALALRPDHAEVLNNRGNALKALQRFEEALASYERALKIRPDYLEALSNRGNTLKELKRFEEALANYEHALKVRPDSAEVFNNRGNALKELKRFEEAMASYERAFRMRPDFAEAHLNDALCRLLTGDFERGWERNEWRWQSGQAKKDQRHFAQPLWNGQDEIANRVILLHAEQGYGDTIQFCRYVPLVAKRDARVILEVQPPLRELMSTLAGTAQVVARGDPLPDFDLHCPLLSLPLAFGTLLETIPSATPYLRAASRAVKDWDARLGKKLRPRIGLVWSGRPTHFNDHNRSMSLRSLLSLLEIDATFISLQKDIRPDDAIMLKDRSDLMHFGDALKSFDDTAALVSNLDLIISVDTSVVHLAGALAKPVWVMLPFIPDWRWLLDRDDSPWYPTVRLFRQDDTRAWDGVIARVHTALHEFVQHRS